MVLFLKEIEEVSGLIEVAVDGQVVDFKKLNFDEGFGVFGILKLGRKQVFDRLFIIDFYGFIGKIIQIFDSDQSEFQLVFLGTQVVDAHAEGHQFFEVA